MARWSLALVLAVTAWWCTENTAQAQVFQQLPNGQVVQVMPYPYVVPQYYWVPNNHFGIGRYHRYPAYGVWNPAPVQRSQLRLDPMRHFFTGNGSSYSPGTSQIWSRTR